MLKAILVSIIFLILGLCFLRLKKIKSDPPHKGQKTRWGRRIPGEYYNEGLNLLLGYPFFENFIEVDVSVKRLQIIVEGARTPDKATSKVPISVAYMPIPELLVQYLNNKKEDGVNEQFIGKIQEKVREWSFGTEEGPANWLELNKAQLEASSILIRKISGNEKLSEEELKKFPSKFKEEIEENTLVDIPKYAQQVPTWIWLRYYAQPRPTKFLENEISWAGEDGKWTRIEIILVEIKEEFGKEAIQKLEEAVEKRRNQINAVRNGTGKIILFSLGIRLLRLNIGDIDVTGKVAEMAEEEAKEEQQRKAEELEIKYILARIKELMKKPFNYSPEQALEIMQTERKKVSKTIQETKINISSEVMKKIEEIVKKF